MTSITDIFFPLQVKPSLAVRGVWNSKTGQNRGSSNSKMPAKERHDTWRYFGFELQQEPPNWLHSLFLIFPKLESYFPGCQFGKNPCCRGVLGGPECKRPPWGDCNARTSLDQVLWGTILQKSKKLSGLCHPFLVRSRTFWTTLVHFAYSGHVQYSALSRLSIV